MSENSSRVKEKKNSIGHKSSSFSGQGGREKKIAREKTHNGGKKTYIPYRLKEKPRHEKMKGTEKGGVGQSKGEAP